MATKKICVTLNASQTLTYTETLEVPDTMTESDLAALVSKRQETVDGSDFHLDDYSWDWGTCYAERAKDADLVDGTVAVEDDRLVVTMRPIE